MFYHIIYTNERKKNNFLNNKVCNKGKEILEKTKKAWIIWLTMLSLSGTMTSCEMPNTNSNNNKNNIEQPVEEKPKTKRNNKKRNIEQFIEEECNNPGNTKNINISYKPLEVEGDFNLDGYMVLEWWKLMLCTNCEEEKKRVKDIQKIIAEGDYVLQDDTRDSRGGEIKITQWKKGKKIQWYTMAGDENIHLKVIIDGHGYYYWPAHTESEKSKKTVLYWSNEDMSWILASKTKCYVHSIITDKYTYTKEDIDEINKEYFNHNYTFSHKEGNIYVYTYIVQWAPWEYVQNWEDVTDILNRQTFRNQEFFNIAGKPLTKEMSMPKWSKVLIKVKFSD